MGHGEKKSFLPYSRGIDPTRLRIGHLTIDTYNPTNDLETGRLEFRENDSQEVYEKFIKTHTGEPQEDPLYSQNFVVTRDWSIKAGLASVLNLDLGPSDTLQASISGQRSRRFEVRKPIKFLKETVLKEEGVQDWIRQVLWIQAKGKVQKGRTAWKTPEIWFCAGVVLVQNGKVTANTTGSRPAGIDFNLDAGLLMTGGMPTGQSLANGGVQRNLSTTVGQEYTHADERVWAAKWFQVKIDFRRKRSGDDQKPLVFDLKPAEDLSHGFRPVTDESSEEFEIAEIVGLDEFEDDLDEEHHTVSFDERPYAKEMEGTEWGTYEKYWGYFEAEKK